MAKNYKIASSSLRVRKIERTLNKWSKKGYRYVDMFEGTIFIFFKRVFIVFETNGFIQCQESPKTETERPMFDTNKPSKAEYLLNGEIIDDEKPNKTSKRSGSLTQEEIDEIPEL